MCVFRVGVGLRSRRGQLGQLVRGRAKRRTWGGRQPSRSLDRRLAARQTVRQAVLAGSVQCKLLRVGIHLQVAVQVLGAGNRPRCGGNVIPAAQAGKPSACDVGTYTFTRSGVYSRGWGAALYGASMCKQAKDSQPTLSVGIRIRTGGIHDVLPTP